MLSRLRAWMWIGFFLTPWCLGGLVAQAESLGDILDRKASDIRPQDVIDWTPFEAEQKPGGEVEILVRMSVKGDWKVYTHNLKFSGPAGFAVAKIVAPPTSRIVDPISTQEVDVYTGGEFHITMTGAPAWTKELFPLDITYVGCTQVICLFPYTHHLEAPFSKTLAPDQALASEQKVVAQPSPSSPPSRLDLAGQTNSPAQVTEAQDPAPNAATSSDQPSGDLESQLARQFKDGGLSFGLLLILVFVGGLVSNLTPCVYPMIPITLRLLSKQGESPYKSASYYASGIVLTYSSLGMVAALSGGLFGSLLASTPFNLVFAGLMFALGLSMLGFGDLSKLQMIGSRLGSGAPSHRNTFLMGAGAGLVAAPCTGPILAALLAYIAGKGDGVASGVGLLFTYSLGFALPYIALGGAAAKISKVRVPAQVQVATKLIFASVMFGLSLYYLRVPLYGTFTTLRPYWQRATWIGSSLGLILTFTWLTFPRLSANKISTLLPTLILSIGVFSGSQWATSSSHGDQDVKLNWYHNEEEAFSAARREQKPVFIDMWAEWCESCKKLDATTFRVPEVVDTLAREFILLKIDLTELDAKSEAIQQRYQVQSLPTLIMVPATGELARKKPVMGYVDGPELLREIKAFKQSI